MKKTATAAQSKEEIDRNLAIISSSRDIIYSAGLDSRLTYVSPQAKAYGYSQEDVVGRSIFEFIHPEDRDFAAQAFSNAVKTGKTLPILAYRLRAKDGSYFYMEQKSGVVMRGGKPALITGIMRDVTEKRRVEEELKESEALYKSIFEKAGEGIMILTLGGEKLYCNMAFARMHGYRDVGEIDALILQDIDPLVKKDRALHSSRIKKILAAGKPVIFETKHLHKNGQTLHVAVNASVIRLKSEPHILAIHQDITEQKKATVILAESERKYRTLFESSRDALILLEGPRWKFIRANSETLELLGCRSEADFLKLSFDAFSQKYQPDGRPSAEKSLEMFGKAVETGVSFFEWACKRLDGSPFLAEMKLTRIDAGGGKPLILSSLRDITGRKEIEKALSEGEERYRTLFEHTADGILLMPMNGEELSCNTGFARMHGYKDQKEITSLKLRNFDAPQTAKLAPGRLKEIIAAKGRPVSFEVEHYRKDRSVFPIYVTCNIVRLQGKPYFMGVHRDITEQKLAEEALAASEKKYKLLVENINEIIYSTSNNGVITYVSPSVKRYGFRRKDIIGAKITEALAPEDRKRILKEYRLSIKNGTEIRSEYRLMNPRGKKFWFLGEAKVQRDAGGNITGTAGVLVHITERRRAEQALRTSEEKYRTLIESSFDLIYVIDRNDFIQFANPAALKALRAKSLAEVVGKPRTSFFPPGVAARQRQSLNKVLADGEPLYREVRIEDRGKVQYQETQLVPLKDEAGKTCAVLGISRDITGRKNAEQALRTSEEKYRAMIETTDTGYLILDYKGRVIDANREYVRMTGHRKLREIMGRTVIEWTAPGDKERNARAVAQCGRDGYIRNLVIDYADKRGRVTPVEVNATVVGEGKELRIICLCRDVTERKLAADLLTASERKYRAMFESSRDALMTLEPPDWRFTRANAETLKMFGAASETSFTKMSPWRLSPKYQPDGVLSSQKARAMLSLAVRNGKNYFEWTHKRFDGTLFPAEVLLTHVAFGASQIILASVRDISGRKKTEKDLCESEALLRTVFETSPDVIFVKDLRGRYVKLNRKAVQLMGMEPEEVIGKTDAHIFGPALAAKNEEEDRRVIESGKPLSFVKEMRFPTGEYYMNIIKTPFSKGEKIGMFGVGRDITALKSMESELAMSRAADSLSKATAPMAHDVRNALAIINVYAALINELSAGPTVKAETAKIIKAVKRAARLTSKFQDLAKNLKLEAGIYKKKIGDGH